MLHKSIYIVLFIASLCLPVNMAGQWDKVHLSLITCDAGGDLETLFGHSAIKIQNDNDGSIVVYNYGMFDFKTPGFAVKFMRGKLPYSLGAYSYSNFLLEYQDRKRSVFEQKLNLSDNQKQEIVAFLENNALPENREYKYDFFFDNCSTRIRDIFSNILEIKKDDFSASQKLTFRNLLHSHLEGHLWTKMGIDLIIGAKADKQASPYDQTFLPIFLKDISANLKVDNTVLLAPAKDVLRFDEEQASRKIPTSFKPSYVNIALFLLIIVLYLLRKEIPVFYIARLWYILAFVASMIIVFLWFFTDHLATKTNWNILWLNPLYLFMFYKNNLNRKLVTLTLLMLSSICLLNEFLHFLPQDLPIDYMWFFFPILLIDLFKKNKKLIPQENLSV